MCRYYENFPLFQHRSMVQGMTFSVPCPITLCRVVVSLTSYDDATKASATGDIKDLKQCAGMFGEPCIPQAQGMAGRGRDFNRAAL
nr:MAG TPA: hypothetical protein [Caudoviricetes sp.]